MPKTKKKGKSRKSKKKPYEKRTDLEKIQSQWVKLTGLHNREDWSAAVVRAATATELAATLAIRREFASRSRLDAAFIDGLLKWANGLIGKVDKLLLPLLEGRDDPKAIKDLCKLARKINEKRNGIVHRGEFCSENKAAELIENCQTFVHGVVRLYEPEFTLKEHSTSG